MADQLKEHIWELEEKIEELSRNKPIEIITSVCGGLLDNVVVKIDGKIVKDFDWYHFDWDVYDHDDISPYIGGLDNATQEQAEKQHEKLLKETK
jgi:hypothetical protein